MDIIPYINLNNTKFTHIESILYKLQINIKFQKCNILEENRRNLCDLGGEIIDTTPKAQFINENIDKLDLIKFKSFPVKMIENIKISHRLGENFAQYISEIP